MASVTRISAPSVTPDALPGARVTAQADPNAAGGIARGLQQFAQIAEKAQEKAESAQFLEAKRKLSDWQRTWFDPRNEQGVYGKKGRDALGLVDEIAPEFDQVQSELAGELRSARARTAFLEWSTNQRTSVLDRVNGYAVQEHDAYVKAEFKASVATSAEMAAAAAMEGRWDDLKRETHLGLQTIRARGALEGEAAEVTKFAETAYLSAVHGTAINAMLAQGRILDAFSYFDANAPDLSASASAEIQARMRPLMVAATADAIVDGTSAGLPSAAAIGADVGLDAVWGAQTQQESGQRQYDSNGRVLTSSAGAKGYAQVMPDTAPVAAQYAGVAWDPDLFNYAGDDPARRQAAKDYNERLGKAYMNAQVQAFGSMPLALAAYNAGPGRVQRWTKPQSQGGLGDPRKGEISLADWVARIPFKETREYVEKIMGKVGGVTAGMPAGASGVGAPGPAAMAQVSAGQSLEARMAVARGIADPQVRAQVEAGIQRQHNIQQEDKRLRETEAQKGVWAVVESMDPRTPLSQALAPDQYAFAAQNGMLSNLERRLKERIGGEDPVTPPETLSSLRRIFYDAQRGSSIAQNEVKRMDLHAISMSQADRSYFQGVQLAIMDPGKKDKAAEYARESDLLQNARRRLGMSGQSKDRVWGEFERMFIDAKRAHVDRTGEEPTDVEMDAMIDRLTTPFVRKTWGGMGSVELPAYSATPADVEKIPGPARVRLLQQFQQAGVPDPTPAQVMAAWGIYQQSQAGGTK